MHCYDGAHILGILQKLGIYKRSRIDDHICLFQILFTSYCDKIRCRKEATGTLNDEQLRNLNERLTYLRNLEDKKNQVLSSIEDQGKLTPELKAQILAAQTLVVVEDLYRPYRPKRRTRATIAKEKGLEPLANIIMLQMTGKSIEEEAQAFVSEEKEVATAADAIAGAKDIIAEHISDEADYRIHIRDLTAKKGTISSTAKDPEVQSVL